MALRDAERVAIARLQKGIIKDMEEITAPLNALSKEIRSRVKKMNKVPKGLDITGKIIKEAVRIIAGVGKWV